MVDDACDICVFKAGLVGIVVFRDVALVGGAVYLRALNLDWKVKLGNFRTTTPKPFFPLETIWLQKLRLLIEIIYGLIFSVEKME